MNSVKKPRQRYDKKLLKKICKDNNIELRESYDHVTGSTKIKAKCIIDGCEDNMIEKRFSSFVNGKRYECEKHYKIATAILMKATNLERYGFENPWQNEEIKQKIKDTNIK